MSGKNAEDDNKDLPLAGTTLRVYRYMYRYGKSVGIHEVQNALGLSSSSVAQYHIKKLENAGLVAKDENAQYFVNRMVFENMIRVRRSLIPIQTAYAVSFGTGFILLLLLFRPTVLTSGYLFSLILIGAACAVFSYQTIRAARNSSI
jgi:hypothetical protein